MPKEQKAYAEFLTWSRKNELLRTTTFAGWNITEHEAIKPADIKKKYLYVITKEGEKKYVSNNWKEIKRILYKSLEKTLF